jgi:hypothetical protein
MAIEVLKEEKYRSHQYVNMAEDSVRVTLTCPLWEWKHVKASLIKQKRFMYFESEEGGMSEFEFSLPEELSCLRAWGELPIDEKLVEWMKTAKVGEYFEHRLGCAVRLIDN